MHNLVKISLASLLLTAALTGCAKKSDDTTVTTEHTYEFSFDASAVAGDTVYFSPVYPKGKVYLWNFGDGTTSSDGAAAHVYNGPGAYTVTLVVDGNKDLPIVNRINIYPGPVYADRIATSWNWRHTGSLRTAHGSSTNFTRPDTTFSIGSFGKSKLNINGDTVRFNYISDTRVYYFSQFNGVRPGHSWEVAYDTVYKVCYVNSYQYNADSSTLTDYYVAH